MIKIPKDREVLNHGKVDRHKNNIDDSTLITDSYKTIQNVRRYFKYKCGDDLKLDRDFILWMKSATGLIMGDTWQEWVMRKNLK